MEGKRTREWGEADAFLIGLEGQPLEELEEISLSRTLLSCDLSPCAQCVCLFHSVPPAPPNQRSPPVSVFSSPLGTVMGWRVLAKLCR